ncbi:MAG TPA: AI-2E family transporter [Burkholderiales bacterium]
MLALVIVVAVLYLAREVLIPLALAFLFSFVLAPGVRRLERLRLGRIASTFIMVILAVSILGAVGWVAANQVVSLGAKLPEYRHNISRKIAKLRAPHGGDLGKATAAIKEIDKQASPGKPPLAVTETPPSGMAALVESVKPFAQPLATALAVIVFTVLMLLNRENMRERLIGLIGAGRINLTTQALNEVGDRVGRYLYMQLVVNALFGIPFGIALYFIGIPNALLWGLLATMLRFIPYAGVWVAVAMPAALAFAISSDWSMMAWVLGVFIALELVMVNLAEPLLYGRSTGLAPMAIIIAALFWTWLWGPIGLLMAVPLTVCVAVMGRYIPEMGFLNMLLGVEPVLSPPARFYQRLIALDHDEAAEVAAKFIEEKDRATFYGEVLIPSLGLIERERHAGNLDPACERSVFDDLHEIIDEPRKEGAARPLPACVLAAHDEADHIAAMVLAAESGAHLVPYPLLANEVMQQIEQTGHKAVCISAVPPQAATQAGFLVRRLRRRFPGHKIIVALWTDAENIDRSRSRLQDAGADAVVTNLPDALQHLRDLAVAPASPQSQPQPRARTAG